MKFYGDYHCHTVYSDGNNEIEDIIAGAVRRGLAEVAITDHGPAALGIGVKDAGVYRELRERLQEIEDKNLPTVLVGAEANITSIDGKLDLPDEFTRELDVLIASMHPYTVPATLKDGITLFASNHLRHLGRNWREHAINANTKAIVACLYYNDVDILAHPGLFFEVDVEEVARACVKNKVYFEINCGHEHPDVSAIIKAERTGVDFIVNSDAHFPESVGNFGYGEDIITSLNIDAERIANLMGEGKNLANSI